jgi:hypothetical protein
MASARPPVVQQHANDGDEDDVLTGGDVIHDTDIKLDEDSPAPRAPPSIGDITITEPDYSPLPVGQRPWDLNPEYISDDERKLLNLFRTQYHDVCRPYNDKMCLAYLFTMHNDIPAAARRLKRFTVTHSYLFDLSRSNQHDSDLLQEVRASHKYPSRIWLKDINQKLVGSGYSFGVDNVTDASGQAIWYVRTRYFNLTDYVVEDQIRFLFWNTGMYCNIFVLATSSRF